MKPLWMIVLFFLSMGSFAQEHVFITIGSDAVEESFKNFNSFKSLKSSHGVSVLKIKSEDIERLSKFMHERFDRCGGFILHSSYEEALGILSTHKLRQETKKKKSITYNINQSSMVQSMLSLVQESSIREMILELSKYKNRYYKSKFGVQSQEFIEKKWKSIIGKKSYISVRSYEHAKWPQPSIILTIEGKKKKDEHIIIGGHADSIAGWFRRESATAPGADDNASGIATMTEMIRILSQSDFRPDRTIKFIAYAAEEVGLLGSMAIAKEYKEKNINVVGVVQFDMTNYKGSKDLDIVFMSDYTNDAQNEFLGSLVDKYLPDLTWGYSRCGYACSDHASWHNAGYPASMPFESAKRDMNGHIHTSRDTIDAVGSGGTAHHAQKFAKLGVAFLVEMGKLD